MLSTETRYFGNLPYEDDSVIEFPDGLPGFENERRFLPVELAAHRPLVFLQSLATPALCFPALPVAAIDEHYRLRLEPADLATLGFPAGARPVMGRDVLCLAIVSIEANAITANLLAPVVVSMADAARGAGHRRRRRLFPPPSARRRRGGRMLVMRRRQGETILIGEEIEIHIAQIGRSKVKIGIEAPREMRVVAKERKVVGDQNRAAALGEALFPALVAQALEKAGKLGRERPICVGEAEPGRREKSGPGKIPGFRQKRTCSMAFSIQTNINSLIAQENLRVTGEFQSRTIQRLTSGFRINQSGDDAAGLAIANKFRSDIAELSQGVRNANDGISTLQIVDGGMNNISKMIDRLKTLATQSASGTFTGDRNVLNSEFQSVLSEIDRQAQAVGPGPGRAVRQIAFGVHRRRQDAHRRGGHRQRLDHR